MKYKLKNKLPKILQKYTTWCIPASIEIAMKYLCPDFKITQDELCALIKNQPLSFGIFKQILETDNRFKTFSFRHWGPDSLNELEQELSKSIQQNNPVLISIPISPTDCHTQVCYKLDGHKLTMYDPGTATHSTENLLEIDKKIKEMRAGGGDILIVGLKTK